MTEPVPALGAAPGGPGSVAPLVSVGRARRRQLVSRAFEGSATLAALVAVVVLGIVVWSVVDRGGGAISWGFLTKDPVLFGAGGGIGPAILGTAIIVGFATVISMPLGILIAVYLSEYASGRTERVIKLVLDLLNGLPSIVVGLFVFGLVVVAAHHQSGYAGSLALAIIMLPLIARAATEVLRLVPNSHREAAAALGVSRWRTILGVVLPSSLGGIVTATLLAVARGAGETAPLIFTTSITDNHAHADLFGQALPNIPVTIFTLSEQADPTGFERAWGAALVLVAFIVATNLAARALLARSRTRMAG